MKATLEFNLPEEREEFNTCNKAQAMRSVLWNYDQWLRGILKHPAENMSDTEYKLYEKCRQMLRDIMEENEVEFE